MFADINGERAEKKRMGNKCVGGIVMWREWKKKETRKNANVCVYACVRACMHAHYF